MAQFPALQRSVGGQQLHVVVTCSDRKKRPPSGDLRLGRYRSQPVAARARNWVQALIGVRSERTPAMDLYQGAHWSGVRGLSGIGDRHGLDVHIWVASAGYGLVPAWARLKSYAATFTSGHDDSVRTDADPPTRDLLPRWWALIGGWTGPAEGEARSLEEIARRQPKAALIVAASEGYLAAMAPDLRAAACRLADPDRCLVVSSAANANHPVGRLTIPVDARFQTLLGGARTSLNVRVVAWLMETSAQHGFDRTSAGALARQALERQPPIIQYDRKPLSDEEVLAWISAGLCEAPGASASALLRALRDAGFACEQRRFGALHREVVAT